MPRTHACKHLRANKCRVYHNITPYVCFPGIEARWTASPWMYLGWPIIFLVTIWDMFVAPLLFGPYRLYGRRFQYKEATSEVRSTYNTTVGEALACSAQRNETKNEIANAVSM